MDHSDLKELLDDVVNGLLTSDEAAKRLSRGPFRRTELPFANLDHHRGLRHGIGEVVFGEGKTVAQLVTIVENLSEDGKCVLTTRLDDTRRRALLERFPDSRVNEAARTVSVNAPAAKGALSCEPFVAVLAAGTSDFPVAEEATETLVAMNVAHERVYDVGVAGLHRLLRKLDEVNNASALVVVAGMEGALPSVVSGLLGRPVFAVPTSIGYGASFGGLAALLAMLNSCAPGVMVSNIDNGFSAAFSAASVVRAVLEGRSK
jgi:NCAIR mutase (PurE)-related protein